MSSRWPQTTYGAVAEVNPGSLSASTTPDQSIEYLDIASVDGPGKIIGTTTYRFADAPGRARRLVREGDTIVSTVRPHLRAFAFIARPSANLVVSTGFAVLRPKASVVDPRFLYQTVLHPDFVDFLVQRQTGSNYPAVRSEDVAAAPLPLPPLAEQRKIAAILSSVDETIEKTEAVIAQLDVVKKAMLEELLTRGIPGRHSRFKQTEIGEVPETWRVVPIADLASSVASGWSPECEEVRPGVGEWGVLKTTSITWEGGWDPLHAKRLPAHLAERPEHCVALGDILVTRAGPVERVGVVAVVDSEAPRLMISDKIIRLRLRSGLADPAFVALALSAANAQSHFHQRKTGLASSQVNISQAILCSCPVALPGLEEQALIARAFREHRTRCRAEARLLDQLATLKSALSAALLSGDLRVKEASN